jgi:small-conductance mechanosensitive channel
LQVWGVHVGDLFRTGTIGHRLASAIITIGVAAVIALLVWEGVNVSVEQRLDSWTTSGDLVRAARLRTLLPMLRSALFCAIALVVVLTGLSELGVNIGPLLAGASIFGVALGFGSQKLVQDFITGIFLLLENAMQVGDSITASGLSGTVEKLSIRTIRLRAGDGAVHIIPFSSVGTVTNTNRGVGNAAVKVSVVAGEDYDHVGETLKAIAKEMRKDDNFRHMMRSDLQLWGVDEVQAGVITIAGQIVCSDTGRWGVQREFNRRLLKRFAELGIKLAGPAHYVVLANGGEATAESTDSETEEAAEAAMTEAPEKGDVAKSATSVRNSPPPSALGHTE